MPHDPHNDAPAPREPDRFFREVNIEFLIHELKDPLSVITSNAVLLLDKQDSRNPLSSRQAGSLKRILRNSNKARGMLWQLLEVGRAETACFHCRAFTPEAVLREVVLETIESNADALYEEIKVLKSPAAKFDHLARNGIRLEVSSAAASRELLHDETKFRQIVSNLLRNALDYRRRMLLIHLAGRHECITVAVRDDGPGIAPEHQEAVFQRYKQVGPQAGLARSGHGLGLAISRILARTMGGDITLESQLGQGAVFTLELPLTHPQPVNE